MSLALGVIADDLTGATDLASAIAKRGLRTVIVVGENARPDAGEYDAVVVALKTRSVPAFAAIAAARKAYVGLSELGARRCFFKYCSTFDSTPLGNIGPVTEALADEAGQDLVMHCPTFPETGRAVRGGELFVHGVPLAQTSMRHHPLNPMTQSDLVTLLGEQSQAPVGLVPLQIVRRGPQAVKNQLGKLVEQGCRQAIVDAVNHDDLVVAASAAQESSLAAGATGLGEAIAALQPGSPASESFAIPDGPTLILSGSCSETTLQQLAVAERHHGVHQLDAAVFETSENPAGIAIEWVMRELTGKGVAIVSASASADSRGSHPVSGEIIERTMGEIAAEATRQGVRRIVVAGGETSGAVIEALAIDALWVGPPIDPGVPIVATAGQDPLALILKSGNFGRPDLLVDPFGRQLWQA